MMVKKVSWTGIILATIVLAGCGKNSTASDTTIRLGYFANLTHAQALVGLANGTFTNIEPKVFNAGPAEMEALLAGDIDIAYVGPSPAVNSYVRSNGEALRIISGAASGGASLVTQPELAETALSGKKIASPQQGNTQDVALRTYLADSGLTDSVQVVPISNADQFTLFKQKELDGAWAPEPWASRLVLEANGVRYTDERQHWPNQQFATTVIVVNTTFLQNRPELVKQFLQQHVAVTNWITAHQDEAKQLVNEQIETLTTKKLSDAVLQEAWKYFTVTTDPYPDTIATMANNAFKLEFLGDDQPQLDALYDLTLLNEITGQQY